MYNLTFLIKIIVRVQEREYSILKLNSTSPISRYQKYTLQSIVSVYLYIYKYCTYVYIYKHCSAVLMSNTGYEDSETGGALLVTSQWFERVELCVVWRALLVTPNLITVFVIPTILGAVV